MAMNVGSGDGDDDELVSTINTTPLVDVMLVLLIIFLITIPVVTHSIPVHLPKEISQADQIKPKTVVIAVTRDGDVFWDQQLMADGPALLAKLKEASVLTPQPEIDVRGDEEARYDAIGRVVLNCEKAGINHVAFISQPPPRG
jgi:biopolymer transport protein ExbD